jgi:hypothetical protein
MGKDKQPARKLKSACTQCQRATGFCFFRREIDLSAFANCGAKTEVVKITNSASFVVYESVEEIPAFIAWIMMDARRSSLFVTAWDEAGFRQRLGVCLGGKLLLSCPGCA